MEKVKGKNYSMNSKADERDKKDFYGTPPCLTSTFLDAYSLGDKDSTIWECACGALDMVNVLKERYFNVVGSDKYPVVEGAPIVDFLDDTSRVVPDFIITNPLYRHALQFILSAKKKARKGFAFLLPLSYLHGVERYRRVWLDKDFPLAHIYVFNRYPMLGLPLRADGLIETGMQTYAWFVWEKEADHEPYIHWLDIDKYILRKRGVKT